MVDAIIVAGGSGLLIMLMVMGLGRVGLIDKKRKEGHSLKESVRLVLGNSILAWALTIYALLVVLMLVSGVAISVIMG